MRNATCLAILSVALSVAATGLSAASQRPTERVTPAPEVNAQAAIWRTADRPPEADLKVASADDAAARFVAVGGTIVVGPFDIKIGRRVVVADPWGNQLVLLDQSKGAASHGRRWQRDSVTSSHAQPSTLAKQWEGWGRSLR